MKTGRAGREAVEQAWKQIGVNVTYGECTADVDDNGGGCPVIYNVLEMMKLNVSLMRGR